MGKDKHYYHLKTSKIKIFLSLLSCVSTIFIHQSKTQAFSLEITTPTPFDSRLYPGVGIAERKGDTFFLEKENAVGEILYMVDYSLGAKVKFEESDPIRHYSISFSGNIEHGSISQPLRRRIIRRSSSAVVETSEFFSEPIVSRSDFGVGSFTSSISLSAIARSQGVGTVRKSFFDATNFHVRQKKVPEPTTILGLATILGCGALLKRGNSKKQNKS